MENIPSEEVDFTMDEGYKGMERILSSKKDIDSVFCATDMIAVGAISCLKEHGKRVPEDVRVTGIGHGIVADILTPKLTTVHYHYQTSGMEAARILLEQIHNPEAKRQERMLNYKMMFQGTT